jgi:enamine deaminase RidA (YjgF/YER057c/UK114 family)
MTVIEGRLAALGLILPDIPPTSPDFRYRAARRHNGFACVAGQVPVGTNEDFIGFVTDQTFEAAKRAARLCALRCLGALKTVATLEQVACVFRTQVYVNVAPNCASLIPLVADAASKLLTDVFDKPGTPEELMVGLGVRTSTAPLTPMLYYVEVDVQFGLVA